MQQLKELIESKYPSFTPLIKPKFKMLLNDITNFTEVSLLIQKVIPMLQLKHNKHLLRNFVAIKKKMESILPLICNRENLSIQLNLCYVDGVKKQIEEINATFFVNMVLIDFFFFLLILFFLKEPMEVLRFEIMVNQNNKPISESQNWCNRFVALAWYIAMCAQGNFIILLDEFLEV